MKHPRNLLQQRGLHPKKQWGQNFLIDKNMITRIVDLLNATKDSRIIELGAGTGALTALLCQISDHVVAIERDRDLVALLEQEFQTEPVTILAADAANINLKAIANGHPSLVIGNLPYQISTPILFQLLEQRKSFTKAVLMVQKEVADRLSAQPGEGKNYSILSIRFGAFFLVQKAIQVPRTCFFPRPNVESTVILLEPLNSPLVLDKNEDFFAKVVKSVFASRRKTLLNNLKTHFSHIPPDSILSCLQSLDINPKCRGETLPIQTFANLSQALMTAEKNTQHP